MTAAELQRLVGMSGSLETPQRDGSTLQVPVHILDAQVSFGHTLLLVEPVGGSGQSWVREDRVKVRAR